MHTRITLLAAAAALVLGATGCGDSGTAGTAATDDPSVAKLAGDGVLTLGRAAIAPFVDYGTPNQDKPTKVGVRVHEVRKGRIADFEGFRLDRAQRRAIPYYVDATFENRGRFALSRNLLRASLEDSDGREYRPTTLVVLGGSFRRCPQPARSVLKPGRSFDGCSVVLLPKDASPGAEADHGAEHRPGAEPRGHHAERRARAVGLLGPPSGRASTTREHDQDRDGEARDRRPHPGAGADLRPALAQLDAERRARDRLAAPARPHPRQERGRGHERRRVDRDGGTRSAARDPICKGSCGSNPLSGATKRATNHLHTPGAHDLAAHRVLMLASAGWNQFEFDDCSSAARTPTEARSTPR